MPVFHVSYDIHGGEDEYPGLWAELKVTPYRHILQSSWLVATPETVTALYNRLARHLTLNRDSQGSDRILISEVSGTYYGWLAIPDWGLLPATKPPTFAI